MWWYTICIYMTTVFRKDYCQRNERHRYLVVLQAIHRHVVEEIIDAEKFSVIIILPPVHNPKTITASFADNEINTRSMSITGTTLRQRGSVNNKK